MATDLVRRLARDLTPVGGACTAVRFFEPTRAFFDAMLPFRGLDVFDIGAGQGHVTLALRAEGHAVTGLDIRENTVGGVVANATCYPFPAGAVGLFCRPCHGPWFVEPTIHQLIDRDAAAIVYVGKGGALRGDLRGFMEHFRLAAPNVGKARESVYLWHRRR